jgi:hypothetical protein
MKVHEGCSVAINDRKPRNSGPDVEVLAFARLGNGHVRGVSLSNQRAAFMIQGLEGGAPTNKESSQGAAVVSSGPERP